MLDIDGIQAGDTILWVGLNGVHRGEVFTKADGSMSVRTAAGKELPLDIFANVNTAYKA